MKNTRAQVTSGSTLVYNEFASSIEIIYDGSKHEIYHYEVDTVPNVQFVTKETNV